MHVLDWFEVTYDQRSNLDVLLFDVLLQLKDANIFDGKKDFILNYIVNISIL